MTSPEKKPNRLFQPLTKLFTRWEAQLFIIILLVLFFGQFLSPHFLNLNNQLENTNNFVDIGLMALAMSFIIVTGNIDLSVASNLGMSTVTMALLFQAGVPIWIAVGIGLLVGAMGLPQKRRQSYEHRNHQGCGRRGEGFVAQEEPGRIVGPRWSARQNRPVFEDTSNVRRHFFGGRIAPRGLLGESLQHNRVQVRGYIRREFAGRGRIGIGDALHDLGLGAGGLRVLCG